MSVSQLLRLEATGIGQATLLGNCDSEANKERAMLNKKRFFQKVAIGVALAACGLVAHANVPRGWFMAGSKPQEFETGVDAAHTYQGQASAFLKSKQSSVDGFGTLMQSISIVA
jgi:hypothetical protein